MNLRTFQVLSITISLSPSVDLLLRKKNILKDNIDIIQFIKSHLCKSKIPFRCRKTELKICYALLICWTSRSTIAILIARQTSKLSKKHNKKETLYYSRVTLCLTRLTERWDEVNTVPKATAAEELNSSHYNVALKLKWPIFYPESLTRDKLSYLIFFKILKIVLSIKNNSLELIILKNHLVEYAHLSISDINFNVAIEILDKEFLDRDY